MSENTTPKAFAVPPIAAEILKSDHPLNAEFIKFLDDTPPTKRQARKFLQQNPRYREVKQG